MEEKITAIPAIIFAVFFFTIEVSFTYSVWLNVYLFLVVLGYFFVMRKWGFIWFLLLFPFIPAITTFWSVMIQGDGLSDAWVLLTRTYAFAALGLVFVAGVDFEECLLVLEQYRVPPTFVYGILVVVHAAPEIRREVSDMRDASLLRGKRLYPWSAYYYVKTIFLAMNWRDRYTEAMYSRGFMDNGTRTHFEKWHLARSASIWAMVFILVGNGLLIVESVVR